MKQINESQQKCCINKITSAKIIGSSIVSLVLERNYTVCHVRAIFRSKTLTWGNVCGKKIAKWKICKKCCRDAQIAILWHNTNFSKTWHANSDRYQLFSSGQKMTTFSDKVVGDGLHKTGFSCKYSLINPSFSFVSWLIYQCTMLCIA